MYNSNTYKTIYILEDKKKQWRKQVTILNEGRTTALDV